MEGHQGKQGGPKGPAADSANRTQDHLSIASLQRTTVLLPSMPDNLCALGVLQLSGPRANESHSLFSWPPTSFKDEWHEFAARGWVALALLTDSVSSSHTIPAGPCPLTRLVAAMSAGHASVDIDGAAADDVPSGHVYTHTYTYTHTPTPHTHTHPYGKA